MTISRFENLYNSNQINLDNYKLVVDCGARFLVMGNAIYKSEDRAKLLAKVDSHYKTKKDTKKVSK